MADKDQPLKIASFYNHYGALQFRRRVPDAVLKPVPRALSSSCGTAAFFYSEFDPSAADENTESVYIKKGDCYERIWPECKIDINGKD